MSARARSPLRPNLDGAIVAAAGVLIALGLVMVYSATAPLSMGQPIPPHFLRHLTAVAVGLGAVWVAMRLPLEAWHKLALPLWGASVSLLVATMIGGDVVNGSRRWLGVPALGLSFQPGEFAKWATLLAMAAVLAGGRRGGRRPAHLRTRLIALGLAALPAALLFAQPDTGSAVLLLALASLMLFVAGTPLRAFLAPAVLGGGVLGLAIGLRPYALQRIRGFLDPWATANDEGFQLVQSFVAFGRGGAWGVGLGDGRQKLYYLPEAHTDFVLSVIAEELGLVGVGLVLGAFAALGVAGCRIALRSRSRFALLLAFGMTAFLTVPAALNAAVVMGVVPPTGLTLPFLSYGRTSLLMCFVAVGMLLGVARRDAVPAEPRVGRAEPRRSWERR